MKDDETKNNEHIQEQGHFEGHGMKRSKWMYYVIAIVILIIVIGGGIYLYKIKEKSNPAYYTMHHRMGVEFLKQKSWEQAIKEFSKAADARPDKFEAHYGLAMAYLNTGKMEQSVESFEKAVKIAPNRLDIIYSLGVTYQRMGRLERALEVYHDIAQQNPRSFQVFNNVGIIQMKLGDYEKAVGALKYAIELDANYYPAYFNLARAYELAGKTDLAAEQYRRVKDSASKRPDAKEFVNAADTAMKKLEDRGKK